MSQSTVAGIPEARSSRFDAFLSYASADRREASRVHRYLESFSRAPDGRRLRVYFDQTDIRGGELSRELAAALGDSAMLVVCCSEAAATSTWVAKEIEMFRRERPESKLAVVLLAGTRETALPPVLRDLDVRCHDVRSGRRLGRWRAASRIELLRLVAFLTGRELRELIDWDRRRFVRNAGAALVASLLPPAGVYHYVSRQRRAAPGDVSVRLTYRFTEDEGMGKGQRIDRVLRQEAVLSLRGIPAGTIHEPRSTGWPGRDFHLPENGLVLESDAQDAAVRVQRSTAGVWFTAVRTFRDFRGALGPLDDPAAWPSAIYEARLRAVGLGVLELGPDQDREGAQESIRAFDELYGISEEERAAWNDLDFALLPVRPPILAELELLVRGTPVGRAKGQVARLWKGDEDANNLRIVYFAPFTAASSAGR